MLTANEILKAYTAGRMTAADANAGLKEISARFYLDPKKNILTGEEIANGTAGLLNSGTGSLDKVRIKDGCLVNYDCGESRAEVIVQGKIYAVYGAELVEV